jgi:hypothetical protein
VGRLASILHPFALFLLLLYPTRYADLFAMREIFRAAEAAGLLTPSGRFWGQILGYNIPYHSQWFHHLVRFLAALIAYAPALLLTLALHHRLTFGRHLFDHSTRCARCRKILRHLTEPRCHSCSTPL